MQACLMTAMIEEGARHDTTIDALAVQAESVNLILAGSGTTANTLTYFIWCVLARPELQRALEDEVAGLSDDEITDAALEKLVLLNATLQETLRLYAPAPGSLPREVPEPGATICGYYIPGGVTCSTQAYTLHRDPESWSSPLE